MLRDLPKAGEPRRHARTDVLVIGGGITGLVLATRLAKRGVRTIVVESGGETGSTEPHPLDLVTQVGQRYHGAQNGRCRGLGGTSLRWGGAMLPFLPCDLGPHTAGWPVEWPISIEVLKPYFADIERLFDLPRGPFEIDAGTSSRLAEPAFILRSAKFPAFRLRNAAYTFQNEIHGPELEVWVNATVSRFRLHENGRLADVMAVSPAGNELSIGAQIVVLAAGAIESTRLLLLLDAQHGNRIFEPQDQLGRYFFDHLSAPAATVDPTDRRVLNMTFGTYFESPGMRASRIEPGPSLRNALRLPGAFANLAITSDGENGFTALRAIYRDLQSRSRPNWRNFTVVARDMAWLLQAAWWRAVKRRLLAPRDSTFQLMLVIEQMPDVENTITLDHRRRDRHGNPLAQIKWRVRSNDFESFRALQSALVAYWAESPFAALGSLRAAPESVWRQRLLEEPDVYHPGGSTRMGRDKSSGVVNADLKTFPIDNLFVVSTSAFPSGGGANPTFMLMALALRAADRIAQELRRTPRQNEAAAAQ
jgi:choline dehydrogenase-like flavoprotein